MMMMAAESDNPRADKLHPDLIDVDNSDHMMATGVEDVANFDCDLAHSAVTTSSGTRSHPLNGNCDSGPEDGQWVASGQGTRGNHRIVHQVMHCRPDLEEDAEEDELDDSGGDEEAMDAEDELEEDYEEEEEDDDMDDDVFGRSRENQMKLEQVVGVNHRRDSILHMAPSSPAHDASSKPSERRNKRKNFKPNRSVVYNSYEDCDEEMLDGEYLNAYAMGKSSGGSIIYPEGESDSSTHKMTASFEDVPGPGINGGRDASESDEAAGGGGGVQGQCPVSSTSLTADQPLDLSDATPSAGFTHHRQVPIPPPAPLPRPTGPPSRGPVGDDGSGGALEGSPMDLSVRSNSETVPVRSTNTPVSNKRKADRGPNSKKLRLPVDLSQQMRYPHSFTSPGSTTPPSNNALVAATLAPLLGSLGLPVPVSLSPTSDPSSKFPLPGYLAMNPTDASVIKDYAEMTMKELLALYGFHEIDSLTKDVALSNFSSKKILESMSPSAMGVAALPVTNCTLSSSSTVTSSSAVSSAVPRSAHSSNSTHQQGPLAGTEGLLQSIRSKVDGLNKMGNMSSNHIITSTPSINRPIMPHSINSMLPLAMMSMDPKVVASAMSSPLPSHHTSKSSLSLEAAHASFLPTQTSVIVPNAAAISSSIFKEQGKAAPIDYSRYVKRFANAAECGSNYCKDLNYREHFHCLDCNSRVFVKKEEMIRHFKWHKKRDESLQHGFLRYSPMDDCSEKFPNCSHNRKQTHYHCIKEGCDKVYISTSDVQMHANYHRKDSAIIQEGFQRFRATEDCAAPNCSFHGQRTTHFHCRRPGCNFTFKNKADMEKHKSYHIKDEQLNRDGFKKFMKHEHCTFENCRFSRVCNHIHCIRPGCTYVLHSSGQLYSHKRKHERRDNEMAYRKFKLAQSMMRTLSESPALATGSQGDAFRVSTGGGTTPTTSASMPSTPTSAGALPLTTSASAQAMNDIYSAAFQQSLSKFSMLSGGGQQRLEMEPHSALLSETSPGSGVNPMSMMEMGLEFRPKPDNSWKKYLSRYSANDPCKPHCDFLYKDHYHCIAENCDMMFRSKDGVREHARNHEHQDEITEVAYTTVEPGQNICPLDCEVQSKEKHYHCKWNGCEEIIRSSDKPFCRLDHYKIHGYAQKANYNKDYFNLPFASPMDGIFKRKRGRPPKNRMVEFPVTSGASEAIFTTFKLSKPSHMSTSSLTDTKLSPVIGHHFPLLTQIPSSSSSASTSPPVAINNKMIPGSGPSCTSPLASPSSSTLEPSNQLLLTQPKVEIHEGFFVYPEGSTCIDQLCMFMGKLHYHCTQPRCFSMTDRSDILILHSKDFHDNIDILDGFVFFDRNVDCRLSSCANNKVNRHFHCTRSNCDFSFVRYSTMKSHDEMHNDATSNTNANVSESPSPSNFGHCHGHGQEPNAATLALSLAIAQAQQAQAHSPQSLGSHESLPSPPGTPRSATTPNGSSAPPSSKSNIVKAKGTFYPLSAFPNATGASKQTRHTSGSHNDSNNTSDADEGQRAIAHVGALQAEWMATLESYVEYSSDNSCPRSFCKLKKREHYHCNLCNQAFSELERVYPHVQKHFGSTSPMMMARCGSHDADEFDEDGDSSTRYAEESCPDDGASSNDDSSNNAYTSNSAPPNFRLPSSSAESTSPVLLHGSMSGTPHHAIAPFPVSPFAMSDDHRHQQHFTNHYQNGIGDYDNDQSPSCSGAPSPSADSVDSMATSPRQMHHASMGMAMSPEDTCKRSAAMAANFSPHQALSQHPFPLHGDFGSMDSAAAGQPLAKKMKMPCTRILKDEPVPEGYIRYRFNEDCHYQHCGYREHQTHFHCMRQDCGYSFCDKTRFVQHTARHERLDTLMGGDFRQFRANVPCGHGDCVYMSAVGSATNKASHFHCLKCEFVCTDTNKVVAHRRQHQKLDSIMAAGFEKFTAGQRCGLDGCAHNQKQTHYHCMKCQYAVLGLSQMSAHKYRHLE